MSLQNLQAELADNIMMDDTRTDLVTPSIHLHIYYNNIFSILIQSLKQTYPLIVQLIGEDFFQVIAREYINHYPSRNGDLHTYGEYFSDFLKEQTALKQFAYLPEVATFEWLCHIVFFAGDHAEFDLKKLSTVSSEQYPYLHFGLHPASRVMQFHYPILQIMDLCHRHIEGPLNVDCGGIQLLIIRRGEEIMFESLTHAEYHFLNALQKDLALIDALNATMLVDNQFDLQKVLPRLIENNIIVQMKTA